MKVSDFFTLSVKKVFIAIAVFFVSVLLHNIISGLIGIEEAFFFLIAVIGVPAYIIISTIWSLIKSKK